MRRTQKRASIPALVKAMIEGGAGFHFSECGSLFADNLGKLPTYLRDEFFNCEGRELVRFLRVHAVRRARGGAARRSALQRF